MPFYPLFSRSTHGPADLFPNHLSETTSPLDAFHPHREYVQWSRAGSLVKPPLEESDFYLRYLEEAFTACGASCLNLTKAKWMLAAYNAEDTLAALSREGEIDLCYSVDSDLVALGAKLVIRPISNSDGPFMVFSRRAADAKGLLPDLPFHAGFSSKDYVFLSDQIRQRDDLLRAVGFRSRDFANAVARRYAAAFLPPRLPPATLHYAEARTAIRVEIYDRLQPYDQGDKHEQYIDVLCDALLEAVLMYAWAPVALSLGSSSAVIVPIRLFRLNLQNLSVGQVERLLTAEEVAFLARNVAATKEEFSARALLDSSIESRDVGPLYAMVGPLRGLTPGQDFVIRRDKRQAVYPRTGAAIPSDVYRPVLRLFIGFMRKDKGLIQLTKEARKVKSC